MTAKITKSHILLVAVIVVLVFLAGYYLGKSNPEQDSLDDQDYSKNNFHSPISNSDSQVWLKRQDEEKSRLDLVRDHCRHGDLEAAIKSIEQEEHPEYINEIISLRSRHNDLNRKVIKGTLTTDEEATAFNKLRSAILNLAEALYLQNNPSAVCSISS